jgi:hypothetical protein
MVLCFGADRAREGKTMTESEIRADTSCDGDKSIKTKQCNKFSIENILGLNDDTKVNRLELMDLCQKGRVRPM